MPQIYFLLYIGVLAIFVVTFLVLLWDMGREVDRTANRVGTGFKSVEDRLEETANQLKQHSQEVNNLGQSVWQLSVELSHAQRRVNELADRMGGSVFGLNREQFWEELKTQITRRVAQHIYGPELPPELDNDAHERSQLKAQTQDPQQQRVRSPEDIDED